MRPPLVPHGLPPPTIYHGQCSPRHDFGSGGCQRLPPWTRWVRPGKVPPVTPGSFGCERWFTGFLSGTRVNGQPSPNDLAKMAVSDGIGPHAHGGFGPHEHYKPGFTPAETALLAERGLHVDNHHNKVYDESGICLTPATVAAMLARARQDGELEDDTGTVGDAAITTKMWSQVTGVGGGAPGEVASAATGLPTVRCLDLRGGWPGSG